MTWILKECPEITELSLQMMGGWLVVADIAIKSFEFQVVTVYMPNCPSERHSFFQQLGLFLDNPKQLVLVDNWNAILDPKIDKARWDTIGLDRYESSLINLLAEHDLVDRFHLDYPGKEMWTGIHSFPSVQDWSDLDRVLVRRADSEFISCPTFHRGQLSNLYTDFCKLQFVWHIFQLKLIGGGGGTQNNFNSPKVLCIIILLKSKLR